MFLKVYPFLLFQTLLISLLCSLMCSFMSSKVSLEFSQALLRALLSISHTRHCLPLGSCRRQKYII